MNVQQSLTPVNQYNNNEINRRLFNLLRFMIQGINIGINQVQYHHNQQIQILGTVSFLRVLMMVSMMVVLVRFNSRYGKRCIIYIYIWIFTFGEKPCKKESIIVSLDLVLIKISNLTQTPRSILPITPKDCSGSIVGSCKLQLGNKIIDLTSIQQLNVNMYAKDYWGVSMPEGELKIIELNGVNVPAKPADLSREERAKVSNLQFSVFEKEGVMKDLVNHSEILSQYPGILMETTGKATSSMPEVLAWYQREIKTKFGVSVECRLGFADNAPSGMEVIRQMETSKCDINACAPIKMMGPFHEHESEFEELVMKDALTDQDIKTYKSLKKKFENDEARLATLESFMEKKYTRQLEYYGRGQLTKWLVKVIGEEVGRKEVAGEEPMDM